jgi:hypothetical protein
MHAVFVRHSYRSIVLGPAARNIGLGLQRRANRRTDARSLCGDRARSNAAGTAYPAIAKCILPARWTERRNLPAFRRQRDW